jgi:hypothetical protein
MVKGKAMTPTPEGVISTSQIWSEAPAEEVEVVEEELPEATEEE